MGSVESPDGNGWDQWKNLVLSELKDLKAGQEKGAESINKLRTDMAFLKGRSGVWGAVAGGITAGVGLLGYWLLGRKP